MTGQDVGSEDVRNNMLKKAIEEITTVMIFDFNVRFS